MFRLRAIPREYAWGSPTAIPGILGLRPSGRPVAEMWFGAHQSGPCPLDGAHPAGDLGRLIASDPDRTLGRDALARFGARLPYLLKLIAPARPLSLQVHPDAERARAGFAREEAAGIPCDAPERNYRDPHHKPELVYAITRFDAVAGFRAPRRTIELLAGLDAAVARRLSETLRADPTSTGVRTAFGSLLLPPTRPTVDEVAELVAACAARAGDVTPEPRADVVVALLAEAFPGDPGVVASLLLNPVTLWPGEAMFIPAGGVHAYLRGVGVEIMANSDNVLRAALTPKHVDVPETLATADFVTAPPFRIAPRMLGGSTRVFAAPVDDFVLSVTDLHDGDHRLPGRGPRIVLCLSGRVALRSAGSHLEVHQGQSIFVPASEGSLTARGRGTLVQADVP